MDKESIPIIIILGIPIFLVILGFISSIIYKIKENLKYRKRLYGIKPEIDSIDIDSLEVEIERIESNTNTLLSRISTKYNFPSYDDDLLIKKNMSYIDWKYRKRFHR